MEENKKDKLDELIRKSVKDIGLESPSADFTKKLLSKIEARTAEQSVTVYKPLISKLGWGLMAFFVVAMSLFALNDKLDIQFAWLEKMNLGALPKLQLTDALPDMAISNIFLYSILIFAVFAAIQMVFLKHRIDRQYA